MNTPNTKFAVHPWLCTVLCIWAISNLIFGTTLIMSKEYYYGSDLPAYLIGPKMILAGEGENLYKLPQQSIAYLQLQHSNQPDSSNISVLPFRASPITALLYIPLLFIPQPFQIFSVSLLGLSIIVISMIILSKYIDHLGFSILLILSSWFVWGGVVQGQPTSLLFLVTGLLYVALVKKQHILCGVLCALYIIKPHYLLIAPVIFIISDRRTLFTKSFLTSIFILVAISVFICGPQSVFYDYPKLLMATESEAYGSRGIHMYSIQHAVYMFSKYIDKNMYIPLVVGMVFYVWGLLKINQAIKKGVPTIQLLPIGLIIAILSMYHVLANDIAIVLLAMLLIIQHYIGSTRNNPGAFLCVGLLVLGSTFGIHIPPNYYGLALTFFATVFLMKMGAKTNEDVKQIPSTVNIR